MHPSPGNQQLEAAVAEVETCLRDHDVPRAVGVARQALAKGAQHPLLLNLRALWFEEQGRNHEALADLQRANAMAPYDASILNALGLCLFKLERPYEAAAAFDRATKLAPDFAPAHHNKGWALEATGELGPARRSYERALELHPDYAEALAKLASLAARRADWREARRLAERALALDPRQTSAIFALASADMGVGGHAAAEERLVALAGDPHLPDHDRAYARNLLGDTFDARGRYAEAFEAYEAANAELKRIHSPRYAGAQSAAHVLQWLGDYFAGTPAWPRSAIAGMPGMPAAGLVFLVGFPRSGTTLLEQVLASHPDVVTMDEKEALADSAREFLAGPQGVRRLAALSPSDVAHFRQAYWNRVRGFALEPTGKVFVDKLPFNTVKLPLVAKLFPEAKVLFALRDPRDVLLSCFRRRFRINAYMIELLTLENAARFYDSYMTLFELYRAKLPLDLKFVRHEDLVNDFDGETKAVCDFIGVEWTESMRDFAARAKLRPVAPPSSTQLLQGLSREGIGHWRHYATELAPALPKLEKWLEIFGYSDAKARPALP